MRAGDPGLKVADIDGIAQTTGVRHMLPGGPPEFRLVRPFGRQPGMPITRPALRARGQRLVDGRQSEQDDLIVATKGSQQPRADAETLELPRHRIAGNHQRLPELQRRQETRRGA